MTVIVKGKKELIARLNAIKPNASMMEKVGLTAVGEQKRIVPRATGNLGRSIHLSRHSKDFAETTAGANYAAYVEFGTSAHTIRVRKARALSWVKGGTRYFARSVRHPGTKAQPYMVPGAEAAVEKLFGARSKDNIIIERWNKAA